MAKAKPKEIKLGRPKWMPPDLDEVEELASHGLTQEQIALALGISETTLYERKAELADFADAIKRGQAKGIKDIVNALYINAKVAGNLGAQIFYLKNRAGWKDKFEGELSGKEGKPIEVDVAVKVTVESIDERIAKALSKS
jgi:transcriptional regulator with XRE-family HTH domain